jgi:hypothetical protein
MKFVAVALAVALLAPGCTGDHSTTLRVVKPPGITVRLDGRGGFVAETDPRQNDPSEVRTSEEPHAGSMWGRALVESAGAVCATLSPPGFTYTFSDASDAGLNIDVECQADGSLHRVRIIFVAE